MALVVKDRVRETSTSTGTGAFTLDGAVAGFQSFSAIGTGNTTYYTIVNGTTQWEVGIGTWTSPNQLSRGFVASSTGSLVNFTAGTKDVFVTFPAEGFGRPPAIGDITPNTIGGTTITGNQVRSYGRFTVNDTGVSGYTAELGVDANGYAVIGGANSVGGTINQSILAPAGLQLGNSNTAVVTINAAPTSTYGLNLPPAAGSNNQLLKTDGSGNLGWMDLGSPPAIGGTTPNTITGTVITAKDVGTSAFVIDDSGSTNVICTFKIDQVTFNPTISATDGAFNYPLQLDSGVTFPVGVNLDINRTNSLILSDNSGAKIYVKPPTAIGVGGYNFILPTTAGSANQLLTTDGSGNLSWSNPLTLNGTTDPTAPSNTNTTIYSKSFGGYATLAGRNALNTSFGLQSALWSKNFQIWTTTNATNGLWLNASGTGSGTYTNVNPTAGATKYQSCRRSTYANLITTANQLLGVANGQASFFRGSTAGLGGFFYYARVGFDVWTNGGRFFAGMATGTTVVTAGDPSALNNTVGFCVDAADNGAISFLTRGTAATKASTGLTIVSNKGYDCYIYCSPNSSQYTWQIIDINTGTSASGTATANLPTNTTMQAPEALASNAALTPATSISIGVCKVYVESDN